MWKWRLMKILRKLAKKIEITWGAGILKVCVCVNIKDIEVTFVCVVNIKRIVRINFYYLSKHVYLVLSLHLISPFLPAAERRVALGRVLCISGTYEHANCNAMNKTKHARFEVLTSVFV
jgi:hypothetical protein